MRGRRVEQEAKEREREGAKGALEVRAFARALWLRDNKVTRRRGRAVTMASARELASTAGPEKGWRGRGRAVIARPLLSGVVGFVRPAFPKRGLWELRGS